MTPHTDSSLAYQDLLAVKSSSQPRVGCGAGFGSPIRVAVGDGLIAG